MQGVFPISSCHEAFIVADCWQLAVWYKRQEVRFLERNMSILNCCVFLLKLSPSAGKAGKARPSKPPVVCKSRVFTFILCTFHTNSPCCITMKQVICKDDALNRGKMTIFGHFLNFESAQHSTVHVFPKNLDAVLFGHMFLTYMTNLIFHYYSIWYLNRRFILWALVFSSVRNLVDHLIYITSLATSSSVAAVVGPEPHRWSGVRPAGRLALTVLSPPVRVDCSTEAAFWETECIWTAGCWCGFGGNYGGALWWMVVDKAGTGCWLVGCVSCRTWCIRPWDVDKHLNPA